MTFLIVMDTDLKTLLHNAEEIEIKKTGIDQYTIYCPRTQRRITCVSDDELKDALISRLSRDISNITFKRKTQDNDEWTFKELLAYGLGAAIGLSIVAYARK